MEAAKKSVKKVKKKKSTINMIRCNFCSKVFQDRGALSSHLSVHSTDRPYKCTICDYAGKTQKYLSKHIRMQHTGNKNFGCDICGMTFHFACKLKDHMRVHTGEKPYKCGVCGKSFNALYSLTTHKFIHTGEKPFRCLYCAYACRDSSTLRKHQARHTGTEKIFGCKLCDATCKSKSALKMHVAEKHLKIDVRKHECSVCGKRFKKKTNLTIHIQTVHERSRTAKCEVCGLVLSNRSNISSHMRTHVDVKPYLCNVELCERRFKYTSSLHKHMLSHYPEKQFACEICRKRFIKKSDIERHLNTHKPKVKRVQCDYCGVRFLNTKYLTNHVLRKHSGTEKKYICDVCDFITTNKPSIVMHIKYRHKRMFLTKCKMCDKRFLRATYLKRHYWKVHKFEYIIPKRKKNKPKTKIKEEPLDALDNISLYTELIPKDEPMEAEEVLSELAAENQLEDVPEEVFKELIDPLKERPEGVLRHTLDHRRPESHKYTKDQDTEAQVKRRVRELLEGSRQKKAALALERTRRKYNRLMKKALRNSAIKERKKIKYYNNKQIDKTNTVANANLAICHTQEKDNNTSSHKQRNELLVEQFSIGLETIANIDQDIDKTKATTDTGQARKHSNKGRKDKAEDSQTGNTNMLLEDASTNRNTVANIIDHAMIDGNIDNTRFRQARKDLVEELSVTQDTIDSVDNEVINKPNEAINYAGQVDNYVEENDAVEEEEKGRNKKLKFNIHQCYVCFKLFETKENLLDHCKAHFDVSNIKTWKKCPLCKYTTDLSVTKHLKNVHDIEIKLPYGTYKDDNNDILQSKYYYDVGDEIINKVEIIPSLKSLNRREYTKIDKANRKNKDKGITRNKLVKKGKEWIVVKEKVKIKDCLLPKLDDTANLNITGGYIEHMKELYRLAKKKGVNMLFPCDSCEKVCQTLSALKLHGRKHEVNPKPYKPKVWKHKVNIKSNKSNQAKTKQKCNKVKIKTIINKNVELPKLDRRTKQAQNELYKEVNRISEPKPIVHKHRCRKELKEFYESNIKGGDIEFWQFLKIYNKMSRENINDFSDLEKTGVFGLHTEVPVDSNTEVEKGTNENDTGSKVSASSKNTRALEFKKARLNRKAFEKKRNEIKNKLREEIRCRARKVEDKKTGII